MAGLTLSVPQARFAWQAIPSAHLHRCPQKLGDEVGQSNVLTPLNFLVADVAVSPPQDVHMRGGIFNKSGFAS